MEVMELSRQIMDYLDAFKGSKPVVHNPEAMIIRGTSGTKLKPDEIIPKITDLFNELNITKVEVNSEKSRQMIEQVDATFRKTTEVFDESNGVAGIEKLKHTFEITGFVADYLMGQIEDIGIYVVMWMDKSGFGPMFVETMVVKLHPLEED
ncbi:DUF2120 family protein [Methanosphaera sp. WGK6]|uniref:DUF2120 family protein n=1 Tax=Methanosphaera sp. WGK6 TaxID=1561964 RepID=UPI00084CAE47|nr:DUF2120 family protein [Methanosphaera sp. WGK6]OED30236.1 hypothetical protein NL43_03630 [Methanosphaera sp. WGK6]